MDLMADENDGDTHAQPPLPPLSPVAPVANMLPVADMLPVAGMLPVADSPQPLPPDQHRLPDSGSNIALADPQQLPHVHSQVPIADAQQQAAPEPLQLPPSLPSKPERDHDAVQFTYRGKPENPLSAAYPWLQESKSHSRCLYRKERTDFRPDPILAQKIAQREDARAALPESSFEAPLGIPEDPADVQMQLAGHVDTSEDVLALFSDGSINFSKGGGAGVAFQQNGHWSGKAFALDRLEIDSYEAEAEAIGEAFNTAAEMLAPHHKTVEVFTDHQGLFEAYSGLHEPKEAQKPAFGRVLEAGAQLEGRGVEVRLTWVKGHGVWAGNTMADSLARLGAEASAKELNSDGTRQVHVADDEIARLWASAENASKTRVAAAGPRWARGRLRRIRQVSSAQHRLTKMRSWKTQKDLRRDAKLRQRLVNRWNEREWAA
ncbi:hypothetical protein GGR56DRAFT_675077 [Xylariaceae sp. FL0804]|nr:hypothetical protein GGR56DRAFT_675077 [Xylariaceae sp. FL0804]